MVCVKRAHAHARPYDMMVVVVAGGWNGVETTAMAEVGCMIDDDGMMKG